MTTPKDQPEISAADSWPDVELKRMPNNEMGVCMDFPAPPALKAQFDLDVIGYNFEPKRARRLFRQLGELLEVLGLRDDRYSNFEVDRRGYEDARAEIEKLRAFKRYVHERLDAAGVPADPEPEENAKHGCRVEGRLNFVIAKKTTDLTAEERAFLVAAIRGSTAPCDWRMEERMLALLESK